MGEFGSIELIATFVILLGWVIVLFVRGLKRGVIFSACLGAFSSLIVLYQTFPDPGLAMGDLLFMLIWLYPLSFLVYFGPFLLGAAVRFLIRMLSRSGAPA